MKKNIKRFIAVFVLMAFSAGIFAQITDVVIDETILEPKDPVAATVVAFGPGLFVHGFGHFYAEDYKMGMIFFGSEVVSLVLIGVGYFMGSSSSQFTIFGGNDDEVERGGALTLVSGLALFLGGWLGDIALAGGAAEQYNIEHNLEFKMQQETFNNYTPSLMYTYNF